jgi:hypothetical protein
MKINLLKNLFRRQAAAQPAPTVRPRMTLDEARAHFKQHDPLIAAQDYLSMRKAEQASGYMQDPNGNPKLDVPKALAFLENNMPSQIALMEMARTYASGNVSNANTDDQKKFIQVLQSRANDMNNANEISPVMYQQLSKLLGGASQKAQQTQRQQTQRMGWGKRVKSWFPQPQHA